VCAAQVAELAQRQRPGYYGRDLGPMPPPPSPSFLERRLRSATCAWVLVKSGLLPLLHALGLRGQGLDQVQSLARHHIFDHFQFPELAPTIKVQAVICHWPAV